MMKKAYITPKVTSCNIPLSPILCGSNFSKQDGFGGSGSTDWEDIEVCAKWGSTFDYGTE